MKTEKTIAEEIVERFFGDNPDGQEWPKGFAEALDDQAVPFHPTRRDGVPSNSLVYKMPDGSCIVESNGTWDFGYTGTDCGCWASQPHHCV